MPSGIQIGAGSRVSSKEKMFNEGAIRITNKTRSHDRGRGLFPYSKTMGISPIRGMKPRIHNQGRLVTSEGFH